MLKCVSVKTNNGNPETSISNSPSATFRCHNTIMVVCYLNCGQISFTRRPNILAHWGIFLELDPFASLCAGTSATIQQTENKGVFFHSTTVTWKLRHGRNQHSPNSDDITNCSKTKPGYNSGLQFCYWQKTTLVWWQLWLVVTS